MQIKISSYCLTSWGQPRTELVPGMKVCPCNGPTSLGTITQIGRRVKDRWDRSVPKDVTVLWGTGNKKGKQTVQSPDTLTDFTAYMAAVKRAYDELEALRLEESMFGM